MHTPQACVFIHLQTHLQDDLLQFLLQEDTVEGSLWAHARGEEEQEEEDEYATLVCDVCNQGNDEALMLLCDGM